MLWQGRKIAGAAQRRTRHGLLVQGSVQPPPPGLGAGELGVGDVRGRAGNFGIEWEPLEMTAGLGRLIEALRAAKYGQTSSTERALTAVRSTGWSGGRNERTGPRCCWW